MSLLINRTRTLVVGLGLALGSAAPLMAQQTPDSVVVDSPRTQPRFDASFSTIENPTTAALRGARITYTVSGGITGAANSLRIFDDGFVQYETNRGSATPSPWSIWTRIPQAEVRALKNLVRAVDFGSMPPSFENPREVFDGFDYVIAVELRDGLIKEVRSETGAIEAGGYTQLRLTLDAVVQDVLATEILTVKSFDSAIPGVERTFTLLADGRYRFDVRSDSLGITTYEGRLSDAQRNEIVASAETFDWQGTRLMRSASMDGTQYELRWTTIGSTYAVQIDATSTDVELAMLLDMVAMINERVKHLAD